jgi:hypothetical protein
MAAHTLLMILLEPRYSSLYSFFFLLSLAMVHLPHLNLQLKKYCQLILDNTNGRILDAALPLDILDPIAS